MAGEASSGIRPGYGTALEQGLEFVAENPVIRVVVVLTLLVAVGFFRTEHRRSRGFRAA
jgi:hypothetical protein